MVVVLRVLVLLLLLLSFAVFLSTLRLELMLVLLKGQLLLEVVVVLGGQGADMTHITDDGTQVTPVALFPHKSSKAPYTTVRATGRWRSSVVVGHYCILW